jgi:hypothetical protein
VHSRNILAAVAFLKVFLLGCSDAEMAQLEAGIVREDSAGVRIVSVPTSLLRSLPRWRIDSVPELRVGTVDSPPEYQIHLAQSPVTLSDGRIAVLNGGSQSIRIYHADGSFDREFGSRGRGPGEYEE